MVYRSGEDDGQVVKILVGGEFHQKSKSHGVPDASLGPGKECWSCATTYPEPENLYRVTIV